MNQLKLNNNFELPLEMSKALMNNISGIDALHSHLKNLIYEAEGVEQLNPKNDYARGVLDCLTNIYGLTYAWAFANTKRETK